MKMYPEEPLGERMHDPVTDYVEPYGQEEKMYGPKDLKIHPDRQQSGVQKGVVRLIAVLMLLFVLIFSSLMYYQQHAVHPTGVSHSSVTSKPAQVKPTQAMSALIGQIALVPENASVTTTTSAICWVSFGGKITVTGESGNDVTVKYQPPADQEVPANLGCPTGTQYTMSQTTFAQSNDEYLANSQAQKKEQQEVASILAQNYYGPQQPVDGYHWVVSVNPTSVFRSFDHTSVRFGNSCVIGTAPDGSTQGGTMQERGKADGKTLYEYNPSGPTYGKECPKGTLFFQ